ncbi:MAG: proline racemase family protein [Candidatus Sulfotelmatobacter sp.]|jgi:4-hydroxyproline epimerase
MTSGKSQRRRIRVIDSHTGGEPTRLVVDGGPDLGNGPLAERLQRFRVEHDSFRSAVVNEPRGSDVMVGALLCEPVDPACAAGVIFFNNVGYLGMCGHGTIGLVTTLSYMNRIQPGEHRIETPVGVVTAVLHSNGEVTVNNVASYRLSTNVEVEVLGYGRVRGDVAWGGNWFFLVNDKANDKISESGRGLRLSLDNIEELTDFAWAIRQALREQGITGTGNQEIDHIELFGPSRLPSVDSKNFVLCPGKAYDRSPCGTGTSAKLACLYADGKIRGGQVWKQESIIGSVFEGSIAVREGKIYPSIKGAAFVNAEAEFVLDPDDPFCMGIRA